MRRVVLGIPLAIVLLVAVALGLAYVKKPADSVAAKQSALEFPAVAAAAPRPAYPHAVANIPVLAYHQLDQGCAPSAAVCAASANPETVSRTQFAAELAYLHDNGYGTVTAAQYTDWLAGKSVALPRKPILLTFDDGTLNSYLDSTDLLRQYGFTAVTFVVTEFADKASAGQRGYVGWDATWAQLKSLPSDVWSFGFHAGAHGHTNVTPGAPGCVYFYPCQLPGETVAAYRDRVSTEITQGRAELAAKLGSRLDTAIWAAPYGDAAGSTDHPTSGTDPASWLPAWSASQFPVIFVQTPTRNGVQNDRYRLEVQGTWSEADFEQHLTENVTNGFFNGPPVS